MLSIPTSYDLGAPLQQNLFCQTVKDTVRYSNLSQHDSHRSLIQLASVSDGFPLVL